MKTGTVKWFSPKKGFGFIVPDEGGNDIFVHISSLERARIQNLEEKQRVGYELESRENRVSAINLKLLDN